MLLLLRGVTICPSWRQESQKILILNRIASGALLNDKDWPTFIPVVSRDFSIRQVLSERLTLKG